jgi:DNA modification methylase
MKTIQNGASVQRVDDKTAEQFIKMGWKYCPKSVWKEMNKNKATSRKSRKKNQKTKSSK